MRKLLRKYKDYEGTVEFSLEDGVLFGTIAFINDTVTYEADSLPDLQKEFENAVDRYISLCEKVGKDPNKPFKGLFQVRIDPELHKEAVKQAFKEGVTLNAFVSEAIRSFVDMNKLIKVIKKTSSNEMNYLVPQKRKNIYQFKQKGA